MKRVYLLLSMVIVFASTTQAQYRCATDEVNNKFREQYPQILENEAKLKADILAQLSGMDLKQFANKPTEGSGHIFDDTLKLNVPIVFHIVHDYGSEYISDEAVYAALEDINRVLNKQNPDTNVILPYRGFIPGTQIRYMGNAHIKFHLAQRDPNGNPTKGITRRRSWTTSIASNQSKADQWPPQSYMNIWLIRSFDANSAGAGAFALFPGSVHNNSLVLYDGVIGRYNQTVTDHTLAHELSHTLNIPHVWGANNNAGTSLCGDDGIDDTPPTKGHPGGGCGIPFPLYDTACATGYEKTYSGPIAKNLFNVGDSVNNVTIDYPDTVNAENIMEYTGCAKMFTYLQGVEMRAALRSNVANRDNLVSETNLINTGVMDAATKTIKPLTDLPPVADFSTNGSDNQNSYACVGDNVTFTNRSWNDTITKVEWLFKDAGGATKTASSTVATTQNFANPGWLSVSVTATSNAGTGTTVKDSAVYIAKNVGTPAQGYVQSFDTDPDLNEYPIFNYYKNDNQWSRVTNIGYWDNASMRMKAYDDRFKKGIPAVMYDSPIGDLDEFYTPPFDLTAYAGSQYCNLNFMLAGASATGNLAVMNDVLEISYKTCGSVSWTVLKTLTKGELITAGIDTTEFAPKSTSDWQMKSYLIPTAARTSNVIFRFRYKCGGKVDDPMTGYRATGNNVYIDRLSFNDFPTDVDGISYEKNGFALAPNPTTGSSYVVIKGSNTATKAKVQVTDMAGKLVYSTEANVIGDTRVEIPSNYISVKGVYMVSVSTATQRSTDKLIVY